MPDILQNFKDYVYVIYLIIAGYLGWNHRRIDAVILDQGKTSQKVDSLNDKVDHISDQVDRLTTHLLDKKGK